MKFKRNKRINYNSKSFKKRMKRLECRQEKIKKRKKIDPIKMLLRFDSPTRDKNK